MTAFFEKPILNSPYAEPAQHWELDDADLPTDRIVPRRRSAKLISPIPEQKLRGRQKSFVLDTGHGLSTEAQEFNPTPIIHALREEIARWRALPNPDQWQVTPVTSTLLRHWRALRDDPGQAVRPFFCQVEAVETAIWLREVAPKVAAGRRLLDWLREANLSANPDLFRLALKLATGAGKTTVMAMLIAWQAINAARSPGSRTFSRAFLVITPGITIRDRLRVLMPNDPAYYRNRGLVPTDMLADLGRAKVVITNYHAFQLRETLQLASGTRAALRGHGPDIATEETEGEMLRRSVADLMGMKNVVVLSDEAHHCYRERPQSAEERLAGDERREAEENKAAARLWISGIEAVKRHLGLGAVYDLSATPFFLSGSGWPEGTLFPWVVSDFSLMDAIECGIVKLPRVPVADNLPGQPAPLYRNLWPTIQKRMPKKTRGEKKLDPQKLPTELKTALDALYGHYLKTFQAWEKAEVGVPPVFIVVCNNTTNSELVAEYIAGYERERSEGELEFHQGALELFRNFTDEGDRLHRPRTLLIDSQQIDSGEAIPAAYLDVYKGEIETFRREKAHRDGESAKALSPEDILREVMNTVGRKGRLGGEIRCVVSVSMLTEGWDANTVTHILGLRAFGTKLICEQVIGRALRRLRYHLDPATGLFPVEYADIMGIDGLNFSAQAVASAPTPLRETVHVHAVPGREALEIGFPRVEGYRIELPDERLTADFSKLEPYVLDPAKVGATEVTMSGIIGASETFTLAHLDRLRRSTLVFRLATHLLAHTLRDADERPKLHLFPQAQAIVGAWLDSGLLVCKGGTFAAQLTYRQLADEVCDLLVGAINTAQTGAEIVRALLDPYNPEGTTAAVNFTTSQTDRWQPRPDRSQLNWIILDSDWEAQLAQAIARHRLRQEPQPRPRDPLPPRRRAPTLPPRLPRPPPRRAHPPPRGQGLPRPRRRPQGRRRPRQMGPRRQPPRPLRPLGLCRNARPLHHGRRARRPRRPHPRRSRPMTDKTPVEAITHAATRANIPAAELEPVLRDDEKAPIRTAWARRDPDLDPQLVWRGKDLADWSDLIVAAPPIYLQEQIHPKALIEDLRAALRGERPRTGPDLFDHFGLTETDREAEVEFYRHSRKWSNRMILGDSLAVMASLAEREGLRGQVQAIYIDPPYGIRFNSNFQWSTTSRDVKDGNLDHLTREPEQVKAFRDTWRDGVHSYLTYLRDRLTVARELLTESGSCFVQIGDENVHRVRALMDEVFGEENFVTEILIKKKGSQKSSFIDPVNDYLLWYSRTPRSVGKIKYRNLFDMRLLDAETIDEFSRVETPDGKIVNLKDYYVNGEKLDFRAFPRRVEIEFPGGRLFRPWPITNGGERARQMDAVSLMGQLATPPKGRCWSHTSRGEDHELNGMARNRAAARLVFSTTSLDFKRYLDDFPFKSVSNWWDGLGGASDQIYVVQTNPRILERLILMTTDPGDLVLDPTCGSGTTAFVAEQWGRRWITIDTSRVALALARARIMGAKYPYYLLADSPAGQRKEAEITRTTPPDTPTRDDIRQGFVYRRSAYITSGRIANNAEIDVIWAARQPAVEAARADLNAALAGHPTPFRIETGGRAGQSLDFRATGEVTLPSGEPAPASGLMEWEVPREAPPDWPEAARAPLAAFWQARIARQREIDASIAARAEFEYLYDRPYEDRKRIRVAGPFTVESLSPHRAAAVGAHGELIDELDAAQGRHSREAEAESYVEAILENLRRAGVHQKDKADRIAFTTLHPWPGALICAEGRYPEGDPDAPTERRAGVFIGPEYGTVQRADLVAAAREAAEAGMDVVIACAFNFDAHASEFHRLGRVPVLQARMNPDLHMAGELKAGGGNLFTIFGEPDIAIHATGDTVTVELRGVDIFKPALGRVDSSEADEMPAGSSTPTTTRSPSSSATPTSPPPTSPTRRSAPP
jgi:DNA modification methylase